MMEVPRDIRDQDGIVPTKEWFENNPEGRGHGFMTDNPEEIIPDLVEGDQPLALIKEKYSQPDRYAPLDLSVPRQLPAPLKQTQAFSRTSSVSIPPSEHRSEATTDSDVIEIGEYAASKPPENIFRCCFCGTTFFSTEILLDHIRIHTGDGEVEYKSTEDDNAETNITDQDVMAVSSEILSKDSTNPDATNRKDMTRQSCSFSPDTVSGSCSSFDKEASQLDISLKSSAIEYPLESTSRQASPDLAKVLIQEHDVIPSTVSQLSNIGVNLTTAQYQTTTCEADSTVDIPMNLGQVKTIELNNSTSQNAQNCVSMNTGGMKKSEDMSVTMYECPICKANFDSHFEQQHHQISCRPSTEKHIFLQSVCLGENLTCPLCKIKFPSPKVKNSHHCQGSDRAIKGFNYMYSIADQITSQRHIEIGSLIQPGNFYVASEDSGTGSSEHISNSSETTSKTTLEPKKGKVCEGCNKSFEFSRNLSRHLQCNSICRAVMVAKDPSSVKKGGYRFSFLRSKSTELMTGTSESIEANAVTNTEHSNLKSIWDNSKKADRSWSPRGYSCKICGKKFDNGVRLGVHKRWEHRSINLKTKGKKLRAHGPRKSDRNAGNIVSCKACLKTFKLDSHLQLHFTLRRTCRVQHARIMSLEANSTKGNKAKLLPNSGQIGQLICRICGNQYWLSGHLKAHMKACHGEALSNDVNVDHPEDETAFNYSCKKFYHLEDVPEAYQHLQFSKGYYVCYLCNKRFTQKKIGYEHVLIHLNVNRFRCLLCAYRGRQVSCILQHLKNKHEEDVLLKQKRNSKVKESSDSLDVLEEQHEQDGEELDSSIGSVITGQENLNLEEQHRLDEKLFDHSITSIVEMGEVETGKEIVNLGKPRNKLHEDNKTAEVEISCNIDFTYKPSPKEQDLCQACPGGWKCPFCGVTYGSKSRTVCHIRKHTKSRPYNCCYCSFTASYSYMIYQHLRGKHFKNRTIIPPRKGRIPGISSSTVQHSKHGIHTKPSAHTKHNNAYTNLSTSANIGNTSKKYSHLSSFFRAMPIDKKFTPIRVRDTDLWKCYACARMSPHHSVIRTHAFSHTQLRPYHCLLCSHKSLRMGMLIKHLQTQHEKEVAEQYQQEEHETVLKENSEEVGSGDKNIAVELTDNTVLYQDETKIGPKLLSNNPEHTSLNSFGHGRRRSSRGRQIKTQKSFLDDYIYDFTESESDTSLHSLSVVNDFVESEKEIPKLRKESSLGSKLSSPSKSTAALEDTAATDGTATASASVSSISSGSQKKICLCSCCSFKSVYESVINTHMLLKHNVNRSTVSDSHNTENIITEDPNDAKFATSAGDVETPKQVLTWFPHQWKEGIDMENRPATPTNDAQDKQQKEVDGIETNMVKYVDTGGSLDNTLTKENNEPVLFGPQYLSEIAMSSAKTKDIIRMANSLYTYKAGPVEKTTNFNTAEPTGGFKCSYCTKCSHGKAAAIAHLLVHSGEKPYYCDICMVNKDQRLAIQAHIQENHMKQILGIVEKKTMCGTEESLEENDQNGHGMTNTDVSVNKKSRMSVDAVKTQQSEKLAVSNILKSSNKCHKGILKKNLSFYKQIIFIRGPLEDKLHIEEDKITGRSICPYCNKTFSGRNATKQHSRIHTDERPYYCKLCYHNARNISSILKHLQAQHKDDCKTVKKSASRSQVEGNIKCVLTKLDISKAKLPLTVRTKESDDESHCDSKTTHTDRPQSPQILQQFFTFQVGKIEQGLKLKTLRNGRSRCPYCKKTQTNTYNTKRHIRIHTGEKPYVCNICAFRSTQYSSMRFHLVGRHPEVAKTINSNRPIHTGEQHKPSEGCTDVKLDTDYSRRKRTLASTSKIQNDDMNTLVEEGIIDRGKDVPNSDMNLPAVEISPGKKLQSNKKWTSLYTFEIGPLEMKYQKTKRDSTSGKLRCPFCQKSNFQEKSKLMSHIRIHTDEKPYNCNLCSYKTSQQSSIVHHIRNSHNLINSTSVDPSKRNITPTKEDLVSGGIASDDDEQGVPSRNSMSKSDCVTVELQSVGIDIKDNAGETPSRCSRRLSAQREKNVETTPENVQQETEKMFPKTLGCLYDYVTGEIERNLKVKRNRLSGCYACPFCNKQRFSSQVGLKSHVRTHTKETPYCCKLCKYKSRQQSSMRYHIHKVHGDGKSSNFEDAVVENKEMVTEFPVQNLLSNILPNSSKNKHGQPINQEDTRPFYPSTPRDDSKCKSSVKKHTEIAVYDDGTKDFGDFTFTIGKLEKQLHQQMGKLERDAISGTFTCSYCSQNIKTKYSYLAHIRLHTGEKPYYCKVCNYQAVQHASMKWHIRTHHSIRKGEQVDPDAGENKSDGVEKCMLKTARENATEEQVEVNRDQSNTFEMEFEPFIQGNKSSIEYMQNTSQIKVNVLHHKLEENSTTALIESNVEESSAKDSTNSLFSFLPGMVERNLSFEKDPARDQYICPFCQRFFPSVKSTRKHVRLHTGEKPYQCNICTWEEFEKVKMERHIAENHEKKAKAAGIHQHSNTDNRIDDTCGSGSVKQVWTCIAPYITYTQNEDKEACYLCDLCNHKIAGYSQIVTHIVKFHKVDIRGTKVGNQEMIVKDVAIKSPLGGGASAQIAGVPEMQDSEKIISNKHTTNQAQAPNLDGVKSPDMINSTLFSVDNEQNLVVIMQQDPISKQYICPVCNLHSKEKSLAVNHVKIHTGIASFSCNKCNYMTIQQADMISHISETHPESVLYLKSQEGKLSAIGSKSSRVVVSPTEKECSFDASLEGDTSKCVATIDDQDKEYDVVTDDIRYGKDEIGNTKVQIAPETNNYFIYGNKNLKEVSLPSALNNQKADNNQNSEDISMSDKIQSKTKPIQRVCESTQVKQLAKKGQAELHDAKSNSPRNAHDHNYARCNDMNKKNKEESVNELTALADPGTDTSTVLSGPSNASCANGSKSMNETTELSSAAMPKKRRRSTRRNRTEDVSTQDLFFKEKDGSVVDTKVKLSSSDCDYQMNCLEQSTDLSVINRNRDIDSVTDANNAASTSPSITHKEKNLQTDKLNDTTITNYFICNIGNAERALARNIQRDPLTGFYLCTYCNKSSRLLQTTKIHMRLHTGEKPYECKLCDVKTVQHCSIINHIKHYHPGVLGLAPLKQSRRSKMKRSKPGGTSGAQGNMAAVVSKQLGDRVKKLGSTSPLKTNYKKVSKKLKTAEEDESYVDHQQSQHIFEEMKLPKPKELRKRKIQSKISNLYPRSALDGVSVNKLQTFAKIPIPRLGVKNNLSQKFMQLALDKSFAANTEQLTTYKSVGKNMAIDMSINAQDVTMRVESRPELISMKNNQDSGVDDNPTPGQGSQIKSLKKAGKQHKKKHRRMKEKGRKKSKHSNLLKQIRTTIEAEASSEVSTAKKEKVVAVDPLAMYYSIVIGPIEKDLVFQKDPVTHRVMCPYCKMTLSHVWSAYNHVRLHTGERPFHCSVCDYKAVQLTSMKTHLRTSHQKIISTGVKNSDQSPVKTMAKLPKQKPFNVYNCFSFQEPDGMRNREFKKDPVSGLVECPHCQTSIPRRILVEHICSHTGDKPYRCKSCKHKTTKRSAIIRHVQMYHKEDAFSKYVPSSGNEDNVNRNRMEDDAHKELEEAEAIFNAEKPNKLKIKKRQKLKVKIAYKKRQKHPTSEIIKEEETKSVRKKSAITNEETLKDELKEDLEEKDNIPTSLGVNSIKSNLHQLKVSELYTYNVSKQEQSLIIHKISGMYACPYCTSIFSKVSDAKRHSRIHTGDKPYRCLVCGETTRHQNTMITHVEKMHTSSFCTSDVQTLSENKHDCYAGADNTIIESADDTGKQAYDKAKPVAEDEIKSEDSEKRQAAYTKTILDVGEMSQGDDTNLKANATGLQIAVQDSELGVSRQSKKVMPGANMCTNNDNNQCLVYNEQRWSHDGSKARRAPIEDILEELLTDVNDNRTEQEYTYTSDHQNGQDTLNFEQSPVKNHGSRTGPNDCDNKKKEVDARIKDSQVKPDGPCQSQTITEQSSAGLETPTAQAVQNDAEEMVNYRSDLVMKTCEIKQRKVEKQCGTENNTGDAYQHGKDFQQPSTPLEQSENKQSVLGTDDINSALSSKLNQSGPTRQGSSKANSPKGQLHYSYEPWDEDTCDVIEESNSSMYQCPHCSYRHRTKAVVRTHIRTHTGFKPYICRYCDFKSTHCTTIKKHLLKEHSIGKSDSDTTSSSSDSESSQLKSSSGSVHCLFKPSDEEKSLVLTRTDDTGIFMCSYCDRPFSTEGNLRIHIRTHTGDKPYQCLHCDFRTAYGFLMQKHINMTHKDQSTTKDDKLTERPDYVFIPSEEERTRVLRRCSGSDMYKCDVCGKELVHESDMVVHLRVHSGDTPYYCVHCDEQMMTQAQIAKHITNMHKLDTKN